MKREHWILDESHQLVEVDLLTWAKFFEDIKKHRVASTERGHILVSTVFLGIDHNFTNIGDPLLFETMVFGGLKNDYQIRYHTWDEAMRGHLEINKMTLSGWYGILNFADAEVVYWWNIIPRLETYESWGDTLRWLLFSDRR